MRYQASPRALICSNRPPRWLRRWSWCWGPWGRGSGWWAPRRSDGIGNPAAVLSARPLLNSYEHTHTHEFGDIIGIQRLNKKHALYLYLLLNTSFLHFFILFFINIVNCRHHQRQHMDSIFNFTQQRIGYKPIKIVMNPYINAQATCPSRSQPDLATRGQPR